jgi:sugar phosphate isomerase/epimerase
VHRIYLAVKGRQVRVRPIDALVTQTTGGARGGRGGAGGPGGGGSPEMTQWRASVSLDRFKALRKMYNDAGVCICGFKLGLNLNSPDSEYEYAFNVCEALGANQLTMELPNSATTKRIGEYAAKRKIWVGYHAHTQAHLTFWDEAFSQSPYNGANIDIGHYVAGTSQSPIPFIEKDHARITSMHLKDRKVNDGPNLPWGQGDTPIKEILQLMKKEKHTYPATIELEYNTPPGSTVMAELAKCVQYAKDALA